MLTHSPYLLDNPIQYYDWGAKGASSIIPSLLNIEPENNLSYAELWIGAHPKAPSKLQHGNTYYKLNELIETYPREMLGDYANKKFNGKLPFLLKVLSISEPLSIQLHPDKQTAEILRSSDPANYPDSNHKPEIAIALGDFEALVGFKNAKEVKKTFQKFPELVDYSEVRRNMPTNNNEIIDIISHCYYLSRTNREEYISLLNRLETRFQNPFFSEDNKLKLFIKMKNRYQYDFGLLLLFFLKSVNLKKGQGIYIPPGTHHVYIHGNAVECMATSDNVIRAGLTRKYQDTKSFIKLLDAHLNSPTLFKSEPKNGIYNYATPVEEFSIEFFESCQGNIDIHTHKKPEIILITEGSIEIQWKSKEEIYSFEMNQGQSAFFPAIISDYKVQMKDNAELFRVSLP